MPSPHPDSLPLPGTAIAALQQGNKIEAIRLAREAHGLGLKEAKELVDAYLAGQPALRERLAAAQSVSTRGCLALLFCLVALLAAGLYFLKGRAVSF